MIGASGGSVLGEGHDVCGACMGGDVAGRRLGIARCYCERC